MVGKILLEGVLMGGLLMLVCWLGIRKGAVGMVHLYHRDVQERCVARGLTTWEKIKKRAAVIKFCCLPVYVAYLLVCVYAVNGARGCVQGFWQMLAILFILNLMDRFIIDEWWVGHTPAWTIPGTEDLKPYINARDKAKKWLFGTLGVAAIAAILAGIMALLVK